jgi:hypothetical protein
MTDDAKLIGSLKDELIGSLKDGMAMLQARVKKLERERDALIEAAILEIGPSRWLHRATGATYPTRSAAVAAHRKAAGLEPSP